MYRYVMYIYNIFIYIYIYVYMFYVYQCKTDYDKLLKNVIS